VQPRGDSRRPWEGLAIGLLALSLVLTFLLSLDFSTSPPTFHPFVLLVGFLIAGAIYGAWRVVARSRMCPACGRRIPWAANLCPYCGHPVPPLRP